MKHCIYIIPSPPAPSMFPPPQIHVPLFFNYCYPHTFRVQLLNSFRGAHLCLGPTAWHWITYQGLMPEKEQFFLSRQPLIPIALYLGVEPCENSPSPLPVCIGVSTCCHCSGL